MWHWHMSFHFRTHCQCNRLSVLLPPSASYLFKDYGISRMSVFKKLDLRLEIWRDCGHLACTLRISTRISQPSINRVYWWHILEHSSYQSENLSRVYTIYFVNIHVCGKWRDTRDQEDRGKLKKARRRQRCKSANSKNGNDTRRTIKKPVSMLLWVILIAAWANVKIRSFASSSTESADSALLCSFRGEDHGEKIPGIR